MNVWNPSTKTGKIWENYQQKTSVGQNVDLLYEVGLLCLRIQETFEIENI